MKKLLQSLFILLFIATSAMAQDRTITGTVTASEDGLPLPGVSVKIKGATGGTTTGADGKYTLRVPSKSAILEFSSVGYLSKSVTLSTSSSVNVSLTSDSKSLTDVVVVGYGTVQRKDLIGSVSTVSGEKLKDVPIQSFEQALAGKAAGVNVISSNGVLNNPPVFRIRGFNSISLSSYPLIVVDGVAIFTGDNSSNSSPSNALGDINPADIESIDILKDAASAAIYGSRATNGVVIITTKKGKQGKTKVNYDGWFGSSKAFGLPELLNANEYVMIKNEARVNNGQAPAFSTYNNPDGSLVDVNWYDYAYRTANSHSHALNFSGATPTTSYFVSAGYTKQEGFIRNNDFERKNGRVNLDHKLTDWLKVGVNFSYSNTFNSAPNTGSLPGQAFNTGGLGRLAIVLPPNVSPYNPDGSYNISGTALGFGSSTIQTNYPNMVVLIDKDKFTSETDRFLGSVYADFRLLKNVNFKTSYGLDKLNIESISFQNPLQGDGQTPNGQATNTFSRNNRWNFVNTLSYNGKVGENHNINAYIGAERQKTTTTSWGAVRQNVGDPFFETYQGSFSVINASGNAMGENSFQSYFASLNYNFKQKYFLGGNFRRDGYSGLSTGNKYGNFGGAAVAYAISEEDFFKSSALGKIFSSFKLKASYGQVGNINIGNFPAFSLFSAGLYGAESTLSYSQAGNSLLKWETSKKTDGGISFGLLDGRIQVDASYYYNNISGLILDAPQSPSKGIPGGTIRANVGTMYNKGFEFSVTSSNIQGDDFSWRTTLNFSTLKNQITALAEGNADIFGITGLETTNINRVGYPIGSIFVVPNAGVNPDNGRRMFTNRFDKIVQYNLSAPTVAQRWTYLDGSVAPAIDPSLDGRVYGQAIPKWFGGIDNTFTYKNFDLNIGITFSGGNYIFYGTQAGLRDQRFWNNSTDMLRRWTTPGQVTDIPRVVYGDNISNGSGIPSSTNVQDGKFVKLKNVAFGYTLPKNMLSKLGVSSVRVYAQGSNLIIITPYQGPDPEVSTNGNSNLAPGVDRNSVPAGRGFTVGLNIGF
eukprot:TRINITY_DN238_c0_g4_i1.p1 TRINITY_DN238_c0_g4~~TRINITY_DN238_c0_g4_i1.p1  ORF type:complete len:1040 (+),score=56.25 TRINITY_DN238_c0_g4_i1:1625-4744(+)